MSNIDDQFLSDESWVDVDSNQLESDPLIPWGDINVEDIPIDIKYGPNSNSSYTSQDMLWVEDKMDFQNDKHSNSDSTSDSTSDKNCSSPISDDSVSVLCIEEAPELVFNPLLNAERIYAAQKLCIKLRTNNKALCYKGTGLIFKHKPVVTISAKGDGACLFYTFSFLLAGTDTYAQIIRHVICNYISALSNYTKIKEHMPSMYTSGQDYVLNSNMQSLYRWGTDMEILVFFTVNRP